MQRLEFGNGARANMPDVGLVPIIRETGPFTRNRLYIPPAAIQPGDLLVVTANYPCVVESDHGPDDCHDRDPRERLNNCHDLLPD